MGRLRVLHVAAPFFLLFLTSQVDRRAATMMSATMKSFTTLLLLAALTDHQQNQVHAFAPSSSSFINGQHSVGVSSRLKTPAAPIHMMMDPLAFAETSTNVFNSIADFSSTNLLAFTDQGQNLAGTFFQASLLPYLAFLYLLAFRGNRITELGNFGFQFILFFVLTTIPSGIISKSVYGTSLANVDYLHGGAELLLTISTLLIVSSYLPVL